MKKLLFLDFEFRNLVGPIRDIICVAWQEGEEGSMYSLWTEETDARRLFAYTMAEKAKDFIFVAYTNAEAYCLLQVWEEFKCTPKDFQYWDLYLEYRQLTNHCNDFRYGKQLMDGKEIVTTPPLNKWTGKDPSISHQRPQHSLAAACYKLLKIKIDTEHKTTMRDLIISGRKLTAQDEKDILDYCISDVVNLPGLYTKMGSALYKLSGKINPKILREGVLLRGDYAIRTSKMVKFGYAIDEPALRKFSDSTGLILRDAQKVVNDKYPDIAPFLWNEKSQRYVQKSRILTDWVKTLNLPKWQKTDKGEISISKESFSEYFSSDSIGFGGEYLKYLKTKQSLNGFMPRGVGSKRNSFWDSLGDDGRIHASFGIYGAQSARSQPRALGYLLLKSHWMRAFLKPPQGKAIVTIDYASQEFLISALLSEDQNMIDAYQSGDPYLFFAKLDGAIPKEGTKSSHPGERNVYKSVVLGISYLMGAAGLARKLTNDLGKVYTEDQAEELITAFREAFPDFAAWQKELIEEYEDKGRFAKSKLPCGWYMWGDNNNPKSVGNFPIQGFGSSIMRKAVQLAQDRGLDVTMTLHDALYVEYDLNDYTAIDKLYESMEEAFIFYFKKKNVNCRLDIFTWSPEYKPGNYSTLSSRLFEQSDIYLDDNCKDDYQRYAKYFA